MNIKFFKYQGTGNDFIIVKDDWIKNKKISTNIINTLCNRKMGIGADGFIILKKHHTYDFEMKYFNSDGNESTMCGNGGRCIVAFAKQQHLIKNQTTFLAIDGIHKAIIDTNGLIKLKMNDITQIKANPKFYLLNTGSPHYVCFVKDVSKINVPIKGAEIRYSNAFKNQGVNVNFVQILDASTIFVRTYERGVENETLSCGTGVVASAISFSIKNNFLRKKTITIQTLGGTLQVTFNPQNNTIFKNVWLIGEAKFVFEGTYFY